METISNNNTTSRQAKIQLLKQLEDRIIKLKKEIDSNELSIKQNELNNYLKNHPEYYSYEDELNIVIKLKNDIEKLKN
jgi:hypothetical protein